MSPESQPNRNSKADLFASYNNEYLVDVAERIESIPALNNIFAAIDKRHSLDPSDENKIALFSIQKRLEFVMMFEHFEQSLVGDDDIQLSMVEAANEARFKHSGE